MEAPVQTTTANSNDCVAAERSIPSIPYELRIGVTGHQELTDPDAVRHAVVNLLQRLVTVFSEASRNPQGPHSSSRSAIHLVDATLTRLLSAISRVVCPVVNFFARALLLSEWPVVPVSRSHPTEQELTPLKLTVLTSLAPGTDQLVTETVRDFLRHPADLGVVPASSHNGIVEAVLPMPVDKYERTFSTEKDLDSFRNLLQLDQGILASRPQPTVVCPTNQSQSGAPDHDRSVPCDAAGRYIVDASEIILAIWDPARDERPGGPASMVRYALDQGKRVLWLHPDHLRLGTHLVWIAPKNLESGSNTAHLSLPNGMVASPLTTTMRVKELSPCFHKLAAFNRDNAVSLAELREAMEVESRRFVKQADGKLPKPISDTVISRILPYVVRADQLSLRYQALCSVSLRLWPNLTAFAVTLMGFQILIFPGLYWLAWIEVAVLLTCAMAYRVSLHEAWHEKWRNDRRLTEGLRVAMFSSFVMTEEELIESDARDATRGRTNAVVMNPLPFYSASQSWIVATLKRMVRQEHRRFANKIDWNRELSGVAHFLADEWLLRQAEFHVDNGAKHHRLARRNTILRLCLISLIVLVAVLHALGIGHEHNDHEEVARIARIDLWIGWATVALPAWAAALHALAATEEHERLAERSKRMAPLLRRLSERMQAASTRHEIINCIREAEVLLDLENQEWSESLSERKPEFAG